MKLPAGWLARLLLCTGLALGSPVIHAADPDTSAVAGASVAQSAPSADIRDIRGAKALSSPWAIPAIIAGVVLVSLIGYALWRLLRRRRNEPKLPWQLALE